MGTPANPQKYLVLAAPSAIDGTGAFAGEAIPAGRKIGEIRGERIGIQEAWERVKTMERIMMVEISPKIAVDASKSRDPLRFTNHSCAANAVLRIQQGRIEIHAMRAIAPGEEITCNYGETHHEGRLTCRCGVINCVGKL
jgi:uncharacterized protein